MSLPELNAAVEGMTGEAWKAGPVTRAELQTLMGRYPDRSKRES